MAAFRGIAAKFFQEKALRFKAMMMLLYAGKIKHRLIKFLRQNGPSCKIRQLKKVR
jgi:hypothetical protein